MHAYDNTIVNERFEVLGTFSSHWAACAAMIRTRQPDFVSLGGDKPEDLAEEARMRSARDQALQDEIKAALTPTHRSCRHPNNESAPTECRCHTQMGNDFYFLPSDSCLYARSGEGGK